jgi:hypothetical protein
MLRLLPFHLVPILCHARVRKLKVMFFSSEPSTRAGVVVNRLTGVLLFTIQINRPTSHGSRDDVSNIL